MKTLTLYSDNEENLRLIQQIAKKMGVQSESQEKTTYNGEKMAEALEELAQNVDVSLIIPDPVAWQREQRKNRKLPGRD
jgi:TPP-dependent indolepyruvate ferredoxin oxidoreductase alpha subunit